MNNIRQARKKYGAAYCTILPDSTIVPWRCLTILEYLDYQEDISRGLYSFADIEDEIYEKCVLDENLIRQLPTSLAGEITTVVQNIWETSGARSNDQIVKDFDNARMYHTPSAGIIHKLVELITVAFPYKPEEVYAMDYKTLLIRFAQAESKLLFMGIISERLEFEIPAEDEEDDEEEVPKKQAPIERVDAKALWDAQQSANRKQPGSSPYKAPIAPVNPPKKEKKKSKMSREKWWKKSPILETDSKKKEKIGTPQEAYAISEGMSNWDKTDRMIIQHQMVEQAKHIYADVIAELDKRNSG